MGKLAKNICMSLLGDMIPRFFPLLEDGVRVETPLGCSINSFLIEQLGLSPAYVEERIQTIFLDGKPVDELEHAMITEGATLAFSAAMPGFLGATLRKKSFYAGMRSGISYHREVDHTRSEQGTVILKMFNLLGREVGPLVLKRGAWVPGERLWDILSRQPEDFWEKCRWINFDGKRIDPAGMRDFDWTNDDIFFKALDESSASCDRREDP
jgi:hypothetical protein